MQMARHHNLPGRPGVSTMISHRARSGVIATCLAFLLPGTGLAQVSDPHLSIELRTRAEAARIATVTKPATDVTAPALFEANQGGVGTVRRRADPQAFSMPQKNLTFQQDARFNIGNGLFERIWVTPPASTIASDGLGPLFNTRACHDYQVKDGGGHPPAGPDDDGGSMVVRLGIPTDARPADIKALRDCLSTKGDPVYGHRYSDLSVAGIPSEGRVRVTLRRPDWSLQDRGYGQMHSATHISPRVAPQMIGLGLVEAIPASDIIALADPRDADGDGISDRANIGWSPEYDQPMLGRFGVRASNQTLRQQVADASHSDIGIASLLHPQPWGDCTPGQTACRAAPDGLSTEQDGLELAGDSLDLVTFYSRSLAVPARADVGDAQVLRGKQVFHRTGCISCHRPSFVTHRLTDRPEQGFQLIRPHSDFVVHDMGPGPADRLPAGQASGAEWRTAPLWGIGMTAQVSGHDTYLHDGRARSLTEAILRHDGEARASRDGFVDLTAPALATAADASATDVIHMHILPGVDRLADAAETLAETDCDPPVLRQGFAGVAQAWAGISHLETDPFQDQGRFALRGLTAKAQIAFRIDLPDRGHAAAAHPTRAEAVAFGRGSATFALVMDCAGGGASSV